MTNFNERTNTLLYKNIPVILYSKGLMLVVYDRGQTATYWPKVLLTITAIHLCPGWAAPPWVTGGRKPSVCKLILTLASYPKLTPTATETRTDWPKPSVAPGYIFFFWHPPTFCGRTHLRRIKPCPQVKVIFRYLRPDAPVSLFFCSFTQVHLLIDGSFEGQYVTLAKCKYMRWFISSSHL